MRLVGSGPPRGRSSAPRGSPPASASGSPSRAQWPRERGCSWPTSPPRGSTKRTRSPLGRSSRSLPGNSAPPSSWRPTTRLSSSRPMRPCGSAVMNRSCPTASVRMVSDRHGIEAQGLVRVFKKGPRAVDGIDLRVEPGEIYGFLGPNGAGKSTTVLMLVTLLPPTEGTARVAGYDVVSEGPKVRASIGAALQEAALDPLLTGREHLRLQTEVLAAGQQRVERGFLERRADGRTHLGPFADDVVAGDARGALGGRKQRDEHEHRRGLTCSIRAEEAVDLSRLDPEVDSVDGARALLEDTNEPLSLDSVAIAHDPYASGRRASTRDRRAAGSHRPARRQAGRGSPRRLRRRIPGQASRRARQRRARSLRRAARWARRPGAAPLPRPLRARWRPAGARRRRAARRAAPSSR